MGRLLLAVTAVLGAGLLALPAHANPFEMFGAGARSQGLGGAIGAVTQDYAATFHNPAGLALGPASVGLGLHGAYDRTTILLMPRPDGYDPPGYSARLNPRDDTEGSGVTGGMTLGFSLLPFDTDFAIGAMVRVPFEGFANIDTRFADEREQYFDNQLRFGLLSGRLRSEMISLGLAYRWYYGEKAWLSMGVGLLMLPAVRTVNEIYTPNAADPSVVDANFGIDQTLEQALVAGIIVEPLEWLRIGLTFQDEVFQSVEAASLILLGGNEDEPVLQDLAVAQHYTPPRLSGSVALQGSTWLVTLEGTWLGWSRYLDEHAEAADPAFEDTLNWRLGFEMPMGDDASARFGVGWVPTPVPPQTGRSNHVDTDRLVLAAGGGKSFELWAESFTVDAAVQVHALRATTTHKEMLAEFPDCAPGVTALCDETPDRTEDAPGLRAAQTQGLQTGNTGFPGFTAGGYVLLAGVDLTWRF